MYIAEMAPPASRGRFVSFKPAEHRVGISAGFFSNYLILTLGESGAAWTEALRLGEWNWRWMLGIETLPAVAYLLALSRSRKARAGWPCADATRRRWSARRVAGDGAGTCCAK